MVPTQLFTLIVENNGVTRLDMKGATILDETGQPRAVMLDKPDKDSIIGKIIAPNVNVAILIFENLMRHFATNN